MMSGVTVFLFCPGKNGKSCKGIVKMQKDSAVAEKNTFQNFENIVKKRVKKRESKIQFKYRK